MRVLFCFFWSLHSWRCWWRRRQGVWRYHNGSCTDTLGGLSEHFPETCLFHWWSFFLLKSKASSLGTTLLKCWIIRLSELSYIGLKEFCCKLKLPKRFMA
jgi:hypothetical protein